MNREETVEAMKAMQSFVDKGYVMRRLRGDGHWYTEADPSWDFECDEYKPIEIELGPLNKDTLVRLIDMSDGNGTPMRMALKNARSAEYIVEMADVADDGVYIKCPLVASPIHVSYPDLAEFWMMYFETYEDTPDWYGCVISDEIIRIISEDE